MPQMEVICDEGPDWGTGAGVVAGGGGTGGGVLEVSRKKWKVPGNRGI